MTAYTITSFGVNLESYQTGNAVSQLPAAARNTAPTTAYYGMLRLEAELALSHRPGR